MDYIKRHLEERVLALSRSFSAILLTGPRQAGKTTMLRALADREKAGREYVSLDDLSLRVGPGAVLCMAERFSAFDRNNLIVPVWML